MVYVEMSLPKLRAKDAFLRRAKHKWKLILTHVG